MSDLKENTMDWDLNINFSHITQDPENKELFVFAIINDEKGAIQRKMAKGWKLWDGGDGGYIDKIGAVLEGKSAAKRESEDGSMHASVPVGMASTGQPCEAFLMYMEKDIYQERVTNQHIAKAQRAMSGITAGAKQAAIQKGNGIGGVIREEGTLDINSDVKLGNS